MRLRVWAALLTLLLVMQCLAQPGGSGAAGTRDGPSIPGRVVEGVTFVAAGALASATGDVVTAAGGVLTWRGAEGVATFFLGSADAVLRRPQDGGPSDWALSAPPVLAEGGSREDPGAWLVPLDAVHLLGVATDWVGDAAYLHLPSGVRAPLVLAGDAGEVDSGDELEAPRGASEIVEVAGLPAVRFFVEDDLSLLLLDLDLAPLAYPELTAVIDEAAAVAGGDQALLALITSLSEREWPSTVTFEQDGVSVEVRSFYRFHLYVGDAEAVAPSSPVAGVILLPPTYSLYRPITVSWAGQTATVTFRH